MMKKNETLKPESIYPYTGECHTSTFLYVVLDHCRDVARTSRDVPPQVADAISKAIDTVCRHTVHGQGGVPRWKDRRKRRIKNT